MPSVLLGFRSGFPGLREGFEALGYRTAEVSLQGQETEQGAASLPPAELCIVDFVDAARRIGATRALARRLRAARVPFVALARDAPFHRGVHPLRLAALSWLGPFDGYAGHSLQGASRFGERTLYSANAAREAVYHADAAELHAMRDPAYHRWDVSFVGNLDAARFPEHARRVEFLRALGERLGRTGIRLLLRDGAGLAHGEEVEVIKRSRINLSAFAGCDAGAEPSWGLPERCYGAPACGGFVLSDRRRHAAADFAGDEWADYEGLEDCAVRIARFIAHPEQARAIAERAHARVARDHRYRNRAARLLDFARDVR